ncbi:MAG: NAD-dependent epimerase/dehydratase family protein [Bacteroidota bacterium]
MNVIIAGSSGMIGSLVLAQCLQNDKVHEVRCLVRKPTGQKHNKLKEVIIEDFNDYSQNDALFKDIHIAFFCLGVYKGQVSGEQFKTITVDYTVTFAKALENQSPQATFCFLSGRGADRTEKSLISFSRYKGMAENRISTLNLHVYCFRPAYIYPVERRKEPNLLHGVTRVLYPLLKYSGENNTIRSTELANAMFTVGLNGADKHVLENRDILKNCH